MNKALVVKLVDTKDLKSLPFGSASSGHSRGTKYEKISFRLIKQNQKILKRYFLKNIKIPIPKKQIL